VNRGGGRGAQEVRNRFAHDEMPKSLAWLDVHRVHSFQRARGVTVESILSYGVVGI
jgi:hypothetical protein